jgi:hypothetical protein
MDTTDETEGKLCPFRSVVPTTTAKIGHAITGISDRECDGRDCMMWTTVGDQEGCALLLAARSFITQ